MNNFTDLAVGWFGLQSLRSVDVGCKFQRRVTSVADFGVGWLGLQSSGSVELGCRCWIGWLGSQILSVDWRALRIWNRLVWFADLGVNSIGSQFWSILGHSTWGAILYVSWLWFRFCGSVELSCSSANLLIWVTHFAVGVSSDKQKEMT